MTRPSTATSIQIRSHWNGNFMSNGRTLAGIDDPMKSSPCRSCLITTKRLPKNNCKCGSCAKIGQGDKHYTNAELEEWIGSGCPEPIMTDGKQRQGIMGKNMIRTKQCKYPGCKEMIPERFDYCTAQGHSCRVGNRRALWHRQGRKGEPTLEWLHAPPMMRGRRVQYLKMGKSQK